MDLSGQPIAQVNDRSSEGEPPEDRDEEVHLLVAMVEGEP